MVLLTKVIQIGITNTIITSANIPNGIAGASCLPALTVTKTTSTPNVNSPGLITWTITVTNQSGLGTAKDAQITNTLPSGARGNVVYTSTTSIFTSGSVSRTSTADPLPGTNTPVWASSTFRGMDQW
jgi:uncharacterized repeat protein (TIGR01451 family)